MAKCISLSVPHQFWVQSGHLLPNTMLLVWTSMQLTNKKWRRWWWLNLSTSRRQGEKMLATFLNFFFITKRNYLSWQRILNSLKIIKPRPSLSRCNPLKKGFASRAHSTWIHCCCCCKFSLMCTVKPLIVKLTDWHDSQNLWLMYKLGLDGLVCRNCKFCLIV